MTADRKALGILTLLLLVLTLPFVRRAYFVDDFYFVTMAKGDLQSTPPGRMILFPMTLASAMWLGNAANSHGWSTPRCFIIFSPR